MDENIRLQSCFVPSQQINFLKLLGFFAVQMDKLKTKEFVFQTLLHEKISRSNDIEREDFFLKNWNFQRSKTNSKIVEDLGAMIEDFNSTKDFVILT